MDDTHFERLSAMDLSFLAMEDGRAHMHIGGVSIYEAEPLRGPDGGIDFERVVSFTEAQLAKFPRFRQRLAWVPGFAHPGWVDDDRFNLPFHLRHTALPAPGDVRQLKRLAGRILSQEFDRSKPLWETWFVEGLADDRVAVISKTHHCMADGISGVAMGNLLVGANPDYEPPPPPAWTPRPAPGSARLVADELRHRVTAPLRLLGSSRGEGGGGRSGLRPSGLGGLVGSALRQASDTPLNVPVGPHRRFDWTSLPFDEVRRIGKNAGGTVNDVVLAVATGALREHLQHEGVAVDDLDFRAVVPVNVRNAREDGTLGNRVSELIARLPIDEPDPWSRLLAVVEMTRELKASGQSGAGDLINQAFDLLPTQLLTPLFRLMSGSSVANLIMTNVPGPRVPVYLLGARQLETYPVVPLLANQTLGIALMSYEHGLFWGFNADWDTIPDLHDLVERVDTGFSDLSAAAPATDPDQA
ncbi:MAG: wax ester/triacylglycerol synthase family O-acyltransferase [Acidimicrobiales bacterium]